MLITYDGACIADRSINSAHEIASLAKDAEGIFIRTCLALLARTLKLNRDLSFTVV